MPKTSGGLKKIDTPHSTSVPLWIQQGTKKVSLLWPGRNWQHACVSGEQNRVTEGLFVWQSDSDREVATSPAIVVSCLGTYSVLTDAEGWKRIYWTVDLQTVCCTLYFWNVSVLLSLQSLQIITISSIIIVALVHEAKKWN